MSERAVRTEPNEREYVVTTRQRKETMKAQQTRPGICPLCGSDNVTMHGQNSTCRRCEYSWYRTSTVPTARELWKLYKLRRENAHNTPYKLSNYQRVDQAYRWWLIRVRPETIVPYLPIHK